LLQRNMGNFKVFRDHLHGTCKKRRFSNRTVRGEFREKKKWSGKRVLKGKYMVGEVCLGTLAPVREGGGAPWGEFEEKKGPGPPPQNHHNPPEKNPPPPKTPPNKKTLCWNWPWPRRLESKENANNKGDSKN